MSRKYQFCKSMISKRDTTLLQGARYYYRSDTHNSSAISSWLHSSEEASKDAAEKAVNSQVHLIDQGITTSPSTFFPSQNVQGTTCNSLIEESPMTVNGYIPSAPYSPLSLINKVSPESGSSRIMKQPSAILTAHSNKSQIPISFQGSVDLMMHYCRMIQSTQMRT